MLIEKWENSAAKCHFSRSFELLQDLLTNVSWFFFFTQWRTFIYENYVNLKKQKNVNNFVLKIRTAWLARAWYRLWLCVCVCVCHRALLLSKQIKNTSVRLILSSLQWPWALWFILSQSQTNLGLWTLTKQPVCINPHLKIIFKKCDIVSFFQLLGWIL